MSTGGTTTTTTSTTTTNSATVIPITTTAHHRRRVADTMSTDPEYNISDDDNDSNNNRNAEISDININNCGVFHHYHHHHHTLIKYLLVRKKLPENIVFRVEEWVLSVVTIMQSLRSRKNMVRTVFGLLLFFMVASVFFKFSFNVDDVNGNLLKRENGIFVLPNFKNDLVNAQRVLSESESSSSSSSGDFVQKRQMKEIPVS